jgi:hypothetical protein
MAKPKNPTDSKTVRVTVSRQSLELLEDLARRGVYGRSSAEVAGRFIDEALHRFIDQPKLQVSLTPEP